MDIPVWPALHMYMYVVSMYIFLCSFPRPHIQVPTLLTINRAGDMFKGLETHSTLYVLHHSTPLASLDPLEVIHILKMRPKVPSLSGGSGSVTPPPQFSREATPMKHLSESHTSPIPSPMLGSSIGQKSLSTVSHLVLKPEQERDIAIFRSFCAMKLVMDAIWNSVELATNTHPQLTAAVPGSTSKLTVVASPQLPRHLPRNGKPSKAARKLKLGEDGSPTTGRKKDDQQKGISKEEQVAGVKGVSVEPLHSELYRCLVQDKLHEAKTYISLIHPLNYRLEVLENIFSLLFLTSDEIKQPKMSEGVGSDSVSPMGAGGVAPSLHKSDSIPSPGNGVAEGIASAISSIALIKTRHTFLMGVEMASDLLEMMKGCIFELRTAKIVLTQQSDTAAGGKKESLELSPTTVLKSSVPHTSLHPRSSKLERLINEARWRLKLVSSKYGIAASGMSPAMAVKFKVQSAAYDVFSSSDESVFELSESEDETKIERETWKRVKKTPSREKEKDVTSSITTPTPLQPDTPPNVFPTSSWRMSPPLRSQLSSPTPRPKSITPKLHRSLSPAPKIKHHGSASIHGAKVKAARNTPQGSRHMSPVRSGQTQSSSGSGGKSLPVFSRTAGDDSGDYAADVEEKSPNVTLSRRKRLRSRSSQTTIRKRRQGMSERSESSGGFTKNSVICKMLASPGSLLRMCLKHGSYNQAKEVVKMFKMEGQFGEDFIRFSENFELVSSELSHKSHSIPMTALSSKHTASLIQGSSIMLAPTKRRPPDDLRRNFNSDASITPASAHASLQEAILNATSNYGPLDNLHRLLAPASISKMLFSGDEQLEKISSESAMLRVFSEHVPPLIMLDLVCSSRVDAQIAKRIVELAVSRSQAALQYVRSRSTSLRRVKGSNGGSPEGMVGGPFVLLHTFYEVIGLQQQGVVSQLFASPHSLLTGLLHYLDVNTFTRSRSFAYSLRNAREKLERIIYQKQSELSTSTSEILVELSQSRGSDDHPPPPPSVQQHPNVTIFDDVIRELSGTPEFISTPPSSASSSTKDLCLMRRPSSALRLSLSEDVPEHCGVQCAYVRQFIRYLVKLVDLLSKCLGVSKSDVNSKEMLLVSVLREGPSQLLGWLVFEQGIHPQHLEAMMGDFPQLRTVDVLVKCCSPRLPSNAVISSRQGKYDNCFM